MERGIAMEKDNREFKEFKDNMDNRELKDKKDINIKKTVAVIMLIVLAIVSFTFLADVFSNPDTYSETIESLDERRNDVLAMSASSTAISTGLTLIPGDVAGPIADKLADLSFTLMIVLCAIFLEKYILTLAGVAAFKILIPIACILALVFIKTSKEAFARVGIKLAILGLCLVLLVPASTWATNFIEDSYPSYIEENFDENIKDANETAEMLNENADKDENFIAGFFDTISGGVTGVLEDIESILGNFIEASALLIITSCVIPILTLWLFVWISNLLLGMNIKIPANKGMLSSGSRMRRRALKKK